MRSFDTKPPRNFFHTLFNDFRMSDAGKTFFKELREIKEFYLTDEQRERLRTMRIVSRAVHITGWVLRGMFYKLSPFRRLLLVAGIILLGNFSIDFDRGGRNVHSDTALLGGAVLVLILILELKDKLLAHDELEAGRRIQESLMPERTPNVEGWSVWLFTRSANEVCGDLVDFLRFDDHRFGVAIADVSGKGLRAALLTAKLQATIRALAFNESADSGVALLVSRTNAIFHRDSPSNMFASLLYMECHREEVRFVNAGHLPVLVRRGSTVEEMEKGEPALGLAREIRYTEHAVHLERGELCVLYSDGVTEARNEAGDFFSKDRLMKFLQMSAGTPGGIGTSLVSEVDRFIGTANPADDLSLIILKRE
ncbi:MAG: serine/threonine-protein phosphatase [Bacteroidota bacterium]|nr:serine/threonine-protein phosphatase [Bacteroidota bacterium]